MADAELVFPDKRVYLRPLLVIQLAIAVGGGLIAGLTALISVRGAKFGLSHTLDSSKLATDSIGCLVTGLTAPVSVRAVLAGSCWLNGSAAQVTDAAEATIKVPDGCGWACWAQGKLSMQLLLTFLSVVAGRAMQVYTSANYTRALVGAPLLLLPPPLPCGLFSLGKGTIRLPEGVTTLCQTSILHLIMGACPGLDYQ